MPTHKFEIGAYQCEIKRLGHHPMTRAVRLDPTPDAEAPRGAAILYFYPPADLPSGIGNTRVPNGTTHTSYFHSCYLSDRDFDAVHRLLQSEKPLYFQAGYEHEPMWPGSVTHRMTTAYLMSADEPLGEGTEDADAA